MTRLLLLAFCPAFYFATVLPGAAQLVSIESFPVDHEEPITIRVLNGKDGQPIANLRLVLLAGYSESDIAHRFWHEEAVTDAFGETRLPRPLVNFPFLQAVTVRASLCQTTPRGEFYKIGRIRSEGWSAPDHCGFVHAGHEPGVLTLFVRQGGTPDAHAAPPSLDFASLDMPSASALGPANSLSRPLSHANEIETLLEHEPIKSEPPKHEPSEREPSPAPTRRPSGTATPADSYSEMCVPDR
jgi:hypothetical protein